MEQGIRWTEYGGRGFFSRDGSLELWLALMVDELDRRPPEEPWLEALRDDWHDQATVRFDGLVETRIDAHVISEERRQTLVGLCRTLRRRIALGEPPVTGIALRVGADRWARRDTPSGLLRVTDAVLWLLEVDAH